MAQISLAWLLHQDAVDAPIARTTSIEYLEDAVEVLDIDLSDSEMDYLEEPYEPLAVAGMNDFKSSIIVSVGFDQPL